MIYFKNYSRILNQLSKLKKNYSLFGVKAEFEAEGSSDSDVQLLRSLTLKVDVKLFVKIGGVEAVNDIYSCLEIGVDGIIAPMVESKFGAFKFIEIIKKMNLKRKPHLTLNIETKNGYKNLKEILKVSGNYIDNITVGRSDFSKSFFKKDINPDTNFVDQKIVNISKLAKKNGITTTVGGTVNQNTIDRFSKNKKIVSLIKKIETRKVILPTKYFLKKNAIANALNFEYLYISLKNEISNFKLRFENERLTTINTRK